MYNVCAELLNVRKHCNNQYNNAYTNSSINLINMNTKKKIFFVLIGFLISLPLSVLAMVMPLDEFSDVDMNAWYSSAVYGARQNGWMSGYDNGNFGPNNPVTRAELATILSRYDDRMEKNYLDIRNILCLNKGNSLDELGLKVSDEEKYSKSLTDICQGHWVNYLGCWAPFDAESGEYQVDETTCL